MAVDINTVNAPSITQQGILGQAHGRFLPNDMFSKGMNTGVLIATIPIGSADGNGSLYRPFQQLDPNLIPIEICVGNTALTSGTSYSLGLAATAMLNGAPTTGGATKVANVFMTAQSLVSANASLHPKTAIDGMANLLPANVGKALWQLASDAAMNTTPTGYDLLLTATTASSVNGTVTIMLSYIIPQVEFIG